MMLTEERKAIVAYLRSKIRPWDDTREVYALYDNVEQLHPDTLPQRQPTETAGETVYKVRSKKYGWTTTSSYASVGAARRHIDRLLLVGNGAEDTMAADFEVVEFTLSNPRVVTE